MADTSLGRASLSVTADLSSFTSAMDSAASKTNGFNKANNLAADSTRRLMDATDKANKINAGGGQKTKVTASASGMKLTDMMGIGFFTSAFTKIFDGALSLVSNIASSVINLGAKVIESGSKFQELDNRLKALTGFKGMAKGLQDIMKAGPSASFTALGEAATRLAQMKFRPDAVAGLIKDFNRLGIALGNPEKIVALITDKLADMATEGIATMSALGKLADEGIPIFEAMATRMGISVDELKRRVAAGLVSVTDAALGLQDAANMPNMVAAAQESANSFMGIWSRVSNNIEVAFQNVGASILKGFGLVEMGDSVTTFFDNISTRIKDLEPMLEKIGAFAASVSQLIMDEISTFLFGWKGFTDDTSAENMLSSMGSMAQELVGVLKKVVDVLIEMSEATLKAAKDVGWWANIGSNTARGLQNWVVDPLAYLASLPGTIAAEATIYAFGLNDFANGVDTIGNNANNAANAINNLNNEMQNFGPRDMFTTGQGGSFQSDMEAMAEELEAFDLQWQQLAQEMAKPLRIEEPGWKKFFADNITPLQQYENEIAKLRTMLDGSKEGAMAFALGSANAIKKLKEATGLGGPQQFASAVQAGSAAEFQVRVDEMGKAKNVQEEIRQLMEAAAEVEAQQLEAAREIAEAIKNLPDNMPRPQAIAVALNP